MADDTFCICFLNYSFFLKVSFFRYIYFFFLNSIIKFNFLVDICGIDGNLISKMDLDRFNINYILFSIKLNSRFFLISTCQTNSFLFSLFPIFCNANWSERECWDMLGVFFINHTDLRRILTDYGFCGFPLRKDFPCLGFSEVYYDGEFEVVSYTLGELSQDSRFFFFENPWIVKY